MSSEYNEILTYLNKRYSKQADTLVSDDGNGNTVAVWSNTTIATTPAEYPQTQTEKENFLFFCNGEQISHSAITSFIQDGNDVKLILNIGLLGYFFSGSDVVMAEGKFNA